MRMLGIFGAGALVASAAAIAQEPDQTHVFVSGRDGYHTFRIPAIVRAPSGELLAFCEGRVNSGADHGDIDLVLRTSADDGRSWGDLRVVQEDGEHTIGNPAPVVDRDTGTIWLLFCRDNDRVFVTSSDDAGRTWSGRREITSTVKKPSWRWYATGPCHGIQLEHGRHAGRLLVPCDHGDRRYGGGSQIVYSDDHGVSWRLGGVVEAQDGLRPNECVAVELEGGEVYLNCRNGARVPKRRVVARSDDGGLTFGPLEVDATLVDPVVQASALRVHAGDRAWLAFCNPATTASRRRMTVRNSFDGGVTWHGERVIWPGPAAYSDLVTTAEGRVGLLYENGDAKPYERITFARFAPDWLARASADALLAADDLGGDVRGLDGRAGGTGWASPWRASRGGELVAWWRFDRGFGDASGHGLDGEPAGAEVGGEGPRQLGRGRALALARQGYVDLSAHVGAVRGLRAGTISLWFRTSMGGTGALFAASDSRDASREIRLLLEREKLWYDVRGDVASDARLVSDPVRLGVWHHAAATVAITGEARLWVDGVEAARDLEPFFDAVHDLDRMAIGVNVDSSGPQWHYEGDLDDVAVFAQDLSPAEIAALAGGADPKSLARGGGAEAVRALAEPLPMDRDAEYYVACRARRDGDGDFALVLRGALAQPVAQLGWSGGRFAAGGPAAVAGPVAMPAGKSFVLVAKIRARAGTAGDQVLLAAFPAGAALPSSEHELGYAGESSWTVVSPTFVTETPIESVHLDSGSLGSSVEIGELRIGATWASVVLPAAGPGK